VGTETTNICKEVNKADKNKNQANKTGESDIDMGNVKPNK
jgi:hypothetical protein